MRRRFLPWLHEAVRRALANEEIGADSWAVATVLRYHKHYRAGFLPRAGGMAEQPALLMACIEECEAAVNEHERLEMEEIRSRTSPTSGRGAGARAVGRLDPADRGPGWRNRLKPA